VLRDEAAAIVDEVGDGVEGLAPGDLPMLAGHSAAATLI
jgi:Zn-dependent alcohol dehydrogenase